MEFRLTLTHSYLNIRLNMQFHIADFNILFLNGDVDLDLIIIIQAFVIRNATRLSVSFMFDFGTTIIKFKILIRIDFLF